MYTAQIPGHGVFVIRYPRGNGNLKDWRCEMQELTVGKGRKMRDGKDIAILTIGPLGQVAAQAIEEVCSEHPEISPAHFDMRFLKPIDKDILDYVGANFKRVITMEDGVKKGGLGSEATEFFASRGYKPQIITLGLPDSFVEHGSPGELYKITRLDKQTVEDEILKPLP